MTIEIGLGWVVLIVVVFFWLTFTAGMAWERTRVFYRLRSLYGKDEAERRCEELEK